MNSHNVHFVYVFIQIETHYMLQLVVGILKEPTVSISAAEDACSALLSNPKYVGCDIRSNKGQARPLGRRSEQTVSTKLFHYTWGLGGRETHLARERVGSTASCVGTCKWLIAAWTQLVL